MNGPQIHYTLSEEAQKPSNKPPPLTVLNLGPNSLNEAVLSLPRNLPITYTWAYSTLPR